MLKIFLFFIISLLLGGGISYSNILAQEIVGDAEAPSYNQIEEGIILPSISTEAPVTTLENPTVESLSLEIEASNSILTTPITKDSVLSINRKNLVNTWLRLALTGKNQAEIESALANNAPHLVEAAKSKIRNILVQNIFLKFKRINIYQDSQSLAQVQKLVLDQISFYGLETDQTVRNQIESSLGIEL